MSSDFDSFPSQPTRRFTEIPILFAIPSISRTAMKSTNAIPTPWRAAVLALVLGAAALVSAPTALGQADANPPERMTYQGFLVDGNGAPLGKPDPKNYDVVFRIWTSENGTTAGDRLWSEQQTVTVDEGYFSVMLGEGTAVAGEARPALSTLFKGGTASDRWVGITVKGIGTAESNTDILPRLRLLSSPYAYLATQATKLVRSDNSNDLLSSTGNTLSLSGELDVVAANVVEFGAGVVGKEPNAGKIGYNTFTMSATGALDIVGAGTTGLNRSVRVYAEGGTSFNGPVNAPTFTATGAGFFGAGGGLTGVAKPASANTFTATQFMEDHLVIGDTPGAGANPGWGEALIFRGAPPLSAGWNSENSDPLWIARYNAAANASELRVVIGDDTGQGTDRFVVGTMVGSGVFNQGAVWQHLASIDARGFLGLAGRHPDYPLHFPNALGDKITLWGDANAAHYGFGIDNSTLLIHSDGPGSSTAIGYGRFGAFTKTAQVHSAGILQIFGAQPYFEIVESDGEQARFIRDGGSLYIQGNSLTHGPALNDWRWARYDGDSNWDFPSDRRLKKDIVDAPPMLEKALKIQVRNFRWKSSAEDAPPMLGVIAQELQPLFPHMVTEAEDPQTGETMLSVGYGDFATIAIKSIQELKAQHDKEVDQLKSRIADLESRMKDVLQAAAELKAQADQARSTASVTR